MIRPGDRGVVCLVTDRRRLCGPDAPLVAVRHRMRALARDAAAAGVDLLQVREPDLDAKSLMALVADVVVAASGHGSTWVVVNDRLDVALACGAHGVQLRADSIAPAAARSLAPPGFLVGRSVHSVEEAATAAGADYLIAGTVFPTPSKPGGHQLLGLEGLAAIARRAEVPVLAIGGVSLERLGAAAGAGAAGIAAIRLFLTPGRGAPDAAGLAELVQIVRARFDRGGSGS